MVNVGCLLLVEVGSILVGDEQVGLLLLLLTLGSPVPLLTLHLTEKENLPSISNSNFEKQEPNLVLKKWIAMRLLAYAQFFKTVFLRLFPYGFGVWIRIIFYEYGSGSSCSSQCGSRFTKLPYDFKFKD